MSRVRALIWKEWREQRSVLLAGIAAALAMPPFLAAGAFSSSTRLGPTHAVEMALPVLAIGIWPLFAAAAAANATAGEVGGGTMPFLLSRPVSRIAVWLLKALGALSAALALVVVSTAALGLVRGLLVSTDPFSLDFFRGNRDVFVLGSVLLVVVVVCTLFTSNFVRRPLLAALSGVVMASGTGGLAVVGLMVVGVGPLQSPVMMAHVLLLPVAVAVGAVFGFLRAEVFQASSRRGRVLRALGLTLVIYVGASAPLLWAEMRVPPDRAYFQRVGVHPDGDLFAVTATEYRIGGRSQIWLLNRNGRIDRLGPLGSTVVGFTSDGEWLVYEKGGLLPALGGGSFELRAVRPDGMDDHLLLRDEGRGWVRFAPRGDRLAVAPQRGRRTSDLVVLRASTGVERRIEQRDLGVSWPGGRPGSPRMYVWRWLDDGSGLLLRSSRDLLAIHDLDRGITRTVAPDFFEEEEDSREVSVFDLRDGHLLASVRERVRDGRSRTFRYHLDAHDLATGTTRRLLTRETACGTVEFTPVGGLDRVLFSRCEIAGAGDRRVAFHVVDLRTSGGSGSAGERTLARLPGRSGPRSLVRGERVVVSTEARDGTLTPVVLGLDGGVRRLPEGWQALEWISDDELLLHQHGWSIAGPWRGGPTALAIADLGTGRLRSVYPPGRPDGSFR